MAAIIEKLGIRSTLGPQGSQLEVPFLIRGAILRIDAHAAIQPLLPAYYIEAGMTLAFQSYDLTERGNGIWEATAQYARPQPRGDTSGPGGGGGGGGGGGNPSNPFQAQNKTFQFDTQGGTVRRTKSIFNAFRSPGAPDFQGAIDVNNDQVNGVETEAPGFSWSQTHYYQRSRITPTYINRLRRMSQTINNAPWTSDVLGIEFPAQEVRFRYAAGGVKDMDQVEITYHFVAEEASTETVNGVQFTKLGQDYLWLRYQQVESEGQLIPRAQYAYVEQVYRTSNFAELEP